MKIFVRVKPKAKQKKIEKIDKTHFIVYVKEPPKNGKANHVIAKALADYFNIAISRVYLISGFSAKQKIFEIL